MPDRFATAVWLNPAAMRQCRTFFAKCDTPLLLVVLEVWRGFSAISQSAYPTSWTVAMTKGALFASIPATGGVRVGNANNTSWLAYLRSIVCAGFVLSAGLATAAGFFAASAGVSAD